MELRTYQAGDETFQAEIYNEAAAALPRFVPASPSDILRRVQEKGFEPRTRIFAVENNRPLAYVAWQANGRIGYPWCRARAGQAREGLFTAALAALQKSGSQLVFAAYRTDWKDVGSFFLKHGFKRVREIINFAVELADV